jgi:hypothetical protein
MARYGAQMADTGVAHEGYGPRREVSDAEQQGAYGEQSHQAYMRTHQHRANPSVISQQSYASMPGQGSGPVSPRPRAPSEERRPEVVVHRDMEAEALAAQQAREAQAMEAQEIPPTYDSLVAVARGVVLGGWLVAGECVLMYGLHLCSLDAD